MPRLFSAVTVAAAAAVVAISSPFIIIIISANFRYNHGSFSRDSGELCMHVCVCMC